MGKKCSLEGINTEVANIKNDLIGNGKKGLIRTVNEIKEDVIKIKENMKTKQWIYSGVIAILITISTFLVTRTFG